jgi:hypothetical protein
VSNNSSTPLLDTPELSTEQQILTLHFTSTIEEGDEIPDCSISDERDFFVFTIPFINGERHSLIAWDSKPCGIKLTSSVQDSIVSFSEEIIKNPWVAEVSGTWGRIKCSASSLAKFRSYLTEFFERSESWINVDGSDFDGCMIREKAVD